MLNRLHYRATLDSLPRGKAFGNCDKLRAASRNFPAHKFSAAECGCTRILISWGRQRPDALRGAAGGRRKTYAGKARIEAPATPGTAPKFRRRLSCASQKYSAIRSCRKIRNGHRSERGTGSPARGIASRRIRSARARLPQSQGDNPSPTGAWNAGNSRHGTTDNGSGWFRSRLSAQSIGEMSGLRQGFVIRSTIPHLAPTKISRV